MKQTKFYVVIGILLVVLAIPSIILASWWNPLSWNIWGNVWNSIFYKQPQTSVECVNAKDCQDLYKNCYYSCSQDKCVQINTLVALKPYPDCSSAVSCTPNWTCDWGECKNGYQSQVAVDSNNCGLSSANVDIACIALAKACTEIFVCQNDYDCKEMSCPAMGSLVHEKCVEGRCIFSDEIIKKCSGTN